MADGNFLFEILMEGAEAVKTSLEAIGEAGARAFETLKSAAENVDTQNITAGIDTAKTSIEGLGAAAAQTADPLKNVGASVADVEKAAQQFGTALADVGSSFTSFVERSAAVVGAITAVGIGLAELVKHAAASVLAVERMAAVFGTSGHALETFSFAADQSGIAANKLQRAMTLLNVEMDKLGEGAKSKLDGLGISITRTGNEATDAIEVFKQVANKFHDMEDGAKKTALAADLFGKRMGPLLIPFLNQGSEGIAKMQAEAERLGLTFSKVEQTISLEVTQAFGKLSAVVSATTDHFALLFGPAVAAGVNAITEAIVANKDRFLEWGKTVADVANQVAKDIAAALSGKDADVQNQWVINFRDTLISLGETITGVIIPAFNLLRGAAQVVADAFNAVFGTSLTGDALLIIVVLGKVLGIFGLLGSAISVVTTAVTLLGTAISAFGGIAALANPVVLVVVALAAALAAVIIFWPQISAAATATFEVIMAGVAIAKQALIDWIVTPLEGAWQWIVDAWNATGALLLASWEAVKQFLVDWVSTPIGNAWQWIVDTWNTAVELLTAALEVAKQAVTDWVITPAANAWQWIADAFDNIVQIVVQKAQALWEWLKSLFVDNNPAAGAGEGGGGGGGGESSSVASAVQAPAVQAASAIAASAVSSIADAITAATARAPLAGAGAPAATAAATQVDLRTDGGTFRVVASEAVVQALTTYAVRRKRASLGVAPSSVG